MIDDHVHPFPLAFEPLDLAALTLDVEEGDAAEERRRELEPTRLVTEQLRVRLAAFLGCEPRDAVAERDTRSRQDWSAYLRSLFSDCATEVMLMDAGWHGLPPGDAARYAEVTGVTVWELARLEPVIDRALAEGRSAAEVVTEVDRFMESAAAAGAVGFKTVIAYRTGLAVETGVSVARAEAGLAADRAAGVPVRRAGKALRDLITMRALGHCADLRRPMQVHTGFGDSELRLAEADPLLLDEALRSAEGSAADVVLIHGSFPWHEQAGYLASVRPRVWVELSLSNLFSPATTADRLLRLLDIAPSGRITLGSDGHGAPESHWFATVVLRDAWRAVRARLGVTVTERWLDETEHRMFDTNARGLYRLPEAA